MDLFIVSQNYHSQKIKFYCLRKPKNYTCAKDFLDHVCQSLSLSNNSKRLIPSANCFFSHKEEKYFPTYIIAPSSQIQRKEYDDIVREVSVPKIVEEDFIESLGNIAKWSMKEACLIIQYFFSDEKFSAKTLNLLYSFYTKEKVDDGNFHNFLKKMGAEKDGHIFTPRKTSALKFKKESNES